MPKRHDDRHFGPGPFLLGLEQVGTADEFPWNLPTMQRVAELELSTRVTLLAGENGVGKSTVIEALAKAMGFADQGGELERSGELPPVPRAIGPVVEGQLTPVFAPLVTRTRPRTRRLALRRRRTAQAVPRRVVPHPGGQPVRRERPLPPGRA